MAARILDRNQVIFLQLQQRFGDVVRLEVGPRTLHLVSHPDLARHVLMTLQPRMSQ